MSKPGAERYKDIPLSIVGSTKFGRYSKMSSEETFNMITSDGWSVPFAGYKRVQLIDQNGEGRGIYASQSLNRMFAVIDDDVWMFDRNITRSYIGRINSSKGTVFITENNNNQILFSDSQRLYIYDESSSATPPYSVRQVTTFNGTPGFITFQNTRFISPNITTNLWKLSGANQGLTWPNTSQFEGALQTKPDKCVATIRFPGRGNLLLVMGRTVSEQWYDVGAQLFPYQRSQSSNLDYGCLSVATIAESENFVCWLAANEKSGPVILYTSGGDINHISTDGIDFRLSQLRYPEDSYGYMFKQDGHLFYVITFVSDNVSYAYDFNNQAFYTLCDENMNAFIPKRVAFFNGQYYFVSIRDGNLYQLGTQFSNYDYGDGVVHEVPRVRIPPSIQLPDQSRFIAGYTGFTIEQGQYEFPDQDTRFVLGTEDRNNITTQNGFGLGGGQDRRDRVPKVMLSISVDGSVNFGSRQAIELNPFGRRMNKLMWYRLGASNDLTQQFHFSGFGRFVARDGVTGIYQ